MSELAKSLPEIPKRTSNFGEAAEPTRMVCKDDINVPRALSFPDKAARRRSLECEDEPTAAPSASGNNKRRPPIDRLRVRSAAFLEERVSVLQEMDYDRQRIFDQFYENLGAIANEFHELVDAAADHGSEEEAAVAPAPAPAPADTTQATVEGSQPRKASKKAKPGLLATGKRGAQKLKERRQTFRKNVLLGSMDKETTELVLLSEKAVGELLAVRMVELQCSVRHALLDEASLAALKQAVDDGISFLERLEASAARCGVLKGTLFQECLGRGAHLPRNFPMMAEYPTGVVDMDALLPADEATALVREAIALCGLVRVKLADCNDLCTGATVLYDAKGFFDELGDFAESKALSEWGACCQLVNILSK